MNPRKSVLRIGVSAYLSILSLSVLALSLYILVQAFTQLQHEGLSLASVEPLWWFAWLLGPLTSILFLCASIQTWRTGKWSLLKGLLYASIFQVNILGWFSYTFYFLPSIYQSIGFDIARFKFFLPFDINFFFPITFKSAVSFDEGSSSQLTVGINLLSIVIITLLNKYYRPNAVKAPSDLV